MLSKGEHLAIAALALAGLLFAGVLAYLSLVPSGVPARMAEALPAPAAPARPASNPMPASAPLRPAPATVAAAAPAADASGRRLAEENRLLRRQLEGVLNWILANFRGTFPLAEDRLNRLQLKTVADDFTMDPEAADFVRATPEERSKINDALLASAAVLREIEQASLSVRNPRADKVILQVPSFPEEGRILQDDLYAALESTLGADRFDRFLKVSELDLKAHFYQFGEASRTMIFELAYSDNGEAPRLVIRDAWVMPDGEHTQVIQARESTVTNLPSAYRTYLAWLPDYVAAYATP